MLSLLSLILASGTVLRADTEQWSASTYPDPRTNSTQCNTWPNSTLCDPDHILTDQWRLNIHENIKHQTERLRNADILYNEGAPEECHQNTSEGVKIYVILAKRIQTASNHSTTDTDLTEFGNEIAEQYGLNWLPCKNFLIIVGVEAAKLAYVRTGQDLKLPPNLMEHIFNQYTGLFNAKNYMEGLNNIINEIGEQMINPMKAQSTTQSTEMSEETITISPSTDGSATSEPLSFSSATANVNRQLAPWWMYALMIVAILCAIVALSLLVISRYQAKKCSQTHMQTIISATTNISDSCKAYNNIEKKDLDIKAKNEKGSSLDAIVGTKKRSDVSNGIDTGNSSSGPQKFNYDIKSEMQQGQSKQLEDVTSKPSINFHFFDKNSYEEDAENSGKCSEHSPYSLHIISVSASGQPQLQNINEEKPVSSSSPILDDHEPDTENKGTLQKDTDLSSSDASCAIEGNFVNRSSNCAREFQTSAKSGEQSIKEERLSIAESEDLEYRCEVTRPTTPPKLATRVHLDATALSTDSIAISSSTTRDYSELNTFSLSDLPTPFC